MTYKDINIRKFIELKEIVDRETEELALQTNLIACLNDMTEDEVLNLPLSEYQEKVKDIAFLTEKPEMSPKCPKKININGKKFNVITDPRRMTAGQYIDFQTFINMKDPDKYLHNILACFVEPEGKKYGEYDVLEVADLIADNVNVEEGLGITNFFHLQSRTFIKNILDYSVRKLKKMERKEKNPEVKEKLKEAIVKMREFQDSLEGGHIYTKSSR